MATIACRIDITEVDGKLLITANIPDNAKTTVAGALTEALVGKSAEIMNEILGEDKTVQRIESH